MTKPTLRRALCVLSFASASVMAAAASAQDVVTAKALFDRGLADMEAGRYDTGCKAIAESQRLDPRAGTLFTLAVCESRAGRTATAAARYDEYLRLYDKLPADQQARQGDRPRVAREERDRLLPDIPSLTLSLPSGAPPGLVVKRDGQVMSEVMLGVALPVDPGEHVISIQGPDRPEREQRITLGKGEKKTLVVEVPVAPPAPSPSPPQQQPPQQQQPAPAVSRPPAQAKAPPVPLSPAEVRKRAAYVIGGAGIAGVAAGAVLGGLAIATKIEADSHCGSAIGSNDPTACDTTGLAAGRSLPALGAGSVVALVLGAAGIGTSAALFLTAPRTPAPAAPDKKTRAGALSLSAAALVSPEAVFVGVRGAF